MASTLTFAVAMPNVNVIKIKVAIRMPSSIVLIITVAVLTYTVNSLKRTIAICRPSSIVLTLTVAVASNA